MKFTGRYTAATAKALKGSPRLVCQVTEDGTIYVSKAPKHKTEVHKMAWLYIPAETGERIETICNQHYNPVRGACDCPLWPACSYSNDLTKSSAENTRIFEQGMAAALAALDNENRR